MIPNLPTDNLYKFMALFGLLMVIFSYYLLDFRVSQLEDRISQEILQSRKIHITTDWLNEKILEYKEIIKNSLARQEGNVKSDLSKLNVEISDKEFNELRKTIDDYTLRIQLEAAENEEAISRSKQLIQDVELLIKVGYFSSTIGSLLSLLGFILWYWRVQKPFDESLKAKSH